MYTGTIDINKIRITLPKYKTPPSERKIKKRQMEYKKTHTLYITVREGSCELIEGYTYYILAKQLGLKKVECVYVNKDEKFIEDFTNKEGKIIKENIFKKANYKCYICGDEVVKGKDCSPNNINFGTLDHVIPRAKGGYSNVKNLKCCCRLCNSIKADKELTDDLRLYIKKEKILAKSKHLKTVTEYLKEKGA